MTGPVWQNGRLMDMPNALIPADASAIGAARAVFDGCRLFVRKRERSPAAFTINMARHLERLRHSCETLGIALTYTARELAIAASDVIQALRPEDDMGLRWFVTELARGAEQAPPIVTVFARPLAGYTKLEPYRINFARHTRWAGHGIPHTAKTMSHYASARAETLAAKAAGFDDCLFVNQFGNVTESPRANFLFLSPDEIHSPRVEDGTLAGVTRESLREVLLAKTALRWNERSIGIGQLASYSGVLMLSSSLGVVPVERIGPYRYATAASRVVADQWQRALQDPRQIFPTTIDEFIY
ncbi:hypothetical protein C6Q14_23415 [Burkholderia ambifaria]|jgi:branched-subunit amino acid aminotransferase/4-amino-4-deoxychorismate lyase|uniref:aminotransferase class IV n=1 Tax=Burkholderia ambifaria TaxID=152480 RepID=UPI000D008F62|nr:aminotransferase class IV [Burkholderia ambifaria]PRF99432.1 hypothetical protein C6Q14_23415 [Burkholderia ambifaria]